MSFKTTGVFHGDCALICRLQYVLDMFCLERVSSHHPNERLVDARLRRASDIDVTMAPQVRLGCAKYVAWRWLMMMILHHKKIASSSDDKQLHKCYVVMSSQVNGKSNSVASNTWAAERKAHRSFTSSSPRLTTIAPVQPFPMDSTSHWPYPPPAPRPYCKNRRHRGRHFLLDVYDPVVGVGRSPLANCCFHPFCKKKNGPGSTQAAVSSRGIRVRRFNQTSERGLRTGSGRSSARFEWEGTWWGNRGIRFAIREKWISLEGQRTTFRQAPRAYPVQAYGKVSE